MKRKSAKLASFLLCGSMLFAGGCDALAALKPNSHEHTFKDVATGNFLKTEATCESGSVYYKSCECGEKSEGTFTLSDKLPHDYSAMVESAEYFKKAGNCMRGAEYYKSCVTCGKKTYATFISESLGEHVYTEEVPDGKYLAEEATHTAAALYYKTCICGVPGTETFSYGEKLREYTDEEKVAYQPTSLTMTLYDAENSVYGFTYNTQNEPLRPVLRIAEGASMGIDFEEYPVSYEKAFSYSDTGTIEFYVSKVEVELEPNTQYTYEIFDKYVDTGLEAVTFETKDVSASSFSFAHISDTQVSEVSGTYFEKILKNVVGNNDFIVHTGDIVQKAMYEYEWEAMLHDNAKYLSKIPMMALAGNHEGDYDGHAGEHELNKHFNYKIPEQSSTAKGQYYSFVYGNAKFIMLNANERISGNNLSEEQVNWLISELENNDSMWTIVSMHQPCYSPGRYGSLPEVNGVSEAFKKQLAPIFAQYGVDLVLQGHDHVISRTNPINSAGVAVSETWNTVDGISYSVDPSGVIYLESGPGGNQTRGAISAANASHYYYQLASSKASSWSEITIDGNRMTVSTKYVGSDGSAVSYEGCTWGIEKTESVA